MYLVRRDDIDVARAKVRQHRTQELRRYFEMVIGLELGLATRPHVVQHENGADAREDRPQQMMGTGEVQRPESGADDVVAKLLHQKWMAGWDAMPNLAGDR